MPPVESPSHEKPQFVRLGIAALFFLSAILLAGGIWPKRVSSRFGPTNPRGGLPRLEASASSPSPSGRMASLPPNDSPQQTASTASSGSQVYINFDVFPLGGAVPGGTLIHNQYPPAIFRSDQYHYTFADNLYYYGSSRPNSLDRGPISFPVDTSGFAPLYVDFTTPVNDLKFYVVAVDEYRQGVAYVNVYRNPNRHLVGTIRVDGFGIFNIPLVNVGERFNNVSAIEVVNITDYLGVTFDDFSFTIAPPPSPTPTPTPSPTPFPPTNLIAESNSIKVSLMWDSSVATSYNVKRRTSTSAWVRIAEAVPTTRYEDHSAVPDENYYYAVSANSSSGESADSNVVDAMLVPSCGDYVKPRPAPEHFPDRGNGWALNAAISDRDGLVVSDVTLNGRYMAKMMSVPYFTLKTNRMPPQVAPQRGELTPDSTSPTMRVRLRSYSRPSFLAGSAVSSFGLVARYAVDRITPTSKSCLLITQHYDFRDKQFGCEPSGTMPCSRFYPVVSYRFEGREGEVLESINFPLRLHYRVNGSADNTIAVTRDCEIPLAGCGVPGQSFDNWSNPVTQERLWKVIKNGRDQRQWDNIHQTYEDEVTLPGLSSLSLAGCPEGVHTHWRWGWAFGHQYGSGLPQIGFTTPTNQDVEIGIVRYKPGEEHPNSSYTALISESESIRNLVTRLTPERPNFPARRIRVLGPADVLYWYSATSHEPLMDRIFSHGGFFNPDHHTHETVANETGTGGNSSQTLQDSIKSITYAHVYKEGATTFTNVDLNTLAPLPAGYVALDNRAHRIATEAIVSGPHVVSFNVPSVNDQSAFNDLAILHLERDPFDPDNSVWVDTTILSSDTPAPDFTNRIINARVNNIGDFVIGKLVQPQPDPGDSDLSVTIADLPDPVVVENNLTYTVHVTNSGPQNATGVGLVDVIPSEVAFVSATPSQGTCKFKKGSVYCKFGTLANGASCDVIIVVNLREGIADIPSQGELIVNTAVVAADNDDSQLENNATNQTTTLLPNPNSRPFVTIASPTTGTTYVGPTTVTLSATATDNDGTITSVNFYEGRTLIGTAAPIGGNQYQLSFTANFGPHTLVAVATDSGGRSTLSEPISVFVNGTGTVNITSPSAGSVLDPSSNLTVTASATNISGPITKVEFFANSVLLGEGSPSGNQYSISWNNAPPGGYVLTAVLTDNSGVITNSLPVNISVTNKPTLTILSPTDGMTYPLLSRVVILANAQDSDGFVDKVDFYANGSLIGTGSAIGEDRFTTDWTQVPTGVYSLTAVATDDLGVTTTSAAITIRINTSTPNPGEFIWLDDALPAGAVTPTTDEGWFWVDANPGSLSGTKSHQSRTFSIADAPNSVQFHQHLFEGATATLPINAGDKLFTYVFLDPNNIPREIMLQWKDANGWDHRAYWGENRISLGVNGTASRRFMGELPLTGHWVRLEVPASAVELEGSTLNGMAFGLDGGRATFDLAGKTTENAPAPPSTLPGDFVWIEDDYLPGAILNTVNDDWNWVDNPHYSGTRAHRSRVSVNPNTLVYRSHSFTGAQTPMQVNPGDVLFTYVFLDPSAPPEQLMLQWYDGSSWDHRAVWSNKYLGSRIPNTGVPGTESQRFMGGLPDSGGWYRLEVPASYVGLEGKNVSGMAFSLYGKEPTVTWDRSGKARDLSTIPLPLSATAEILKLSNGSNGFAFETADILGVLNRNWFFAHANQAAGTVPLYRFRRSSEFFYCTGCPWLTDWTKDQTPAFYVYPDATSPGTAPLHLYHNASSKYLLTTNYSEATSFGMDHYDGVWAYVYAGAVPARPSSLAFNGCDLNWTDNSLNESGFKIERLYNLVKQGRKWIQIASVGPNVASLASTCPTSGRYRVRAYNSTGHSGYSNVAVGTLKEGLTDAENTPPEVSVTTPGSGEVVNSTFTITANAFDVNGNGTIAKVEFFANGVKLGESENVPYIFQWNPLPGTHNLTAKATDTDGAATTSSAVSVTVPMINQAISVDSISDKTYGDAPFSVSAIASSGLPVSFNVVAGPAILSGNIITIIGTGTVTVRASQAGDATYNPAAAVDRTFDVAKASATITLNDLNQTFDGTPRVVTATTNPAGLTGVAITYGGIATAPTNTGSYSVVAALTHDNYSATNVTATLVVAKASQTISFNALGNKTYGDAPFSINASSSANLTVSLSILSGPATLSGSTLTITGAGTVTVRASQGGNENYNAAANVDRSFNVAKASATISLSSLSHIYDGTPKSAVASTNPAALSGVTITYNGSAVIPTNAGNYSVVAALTNDNYAAANVTGTLSIAKANPVITWQNPADIAVGTPISATQLNATASVAGAFVYSPPAGTVLDVGNGQQLTVTFTPTNLANYNIAAKEVRINVVVALLLTDDFNDNSLDGTKWTITAPGSPATVSEQGQRLQITIPPNTATYNGVVSNAFYDFRGRTVEVELAQPISQAGWCENFLQVLLDDNNYLLIDAGAGSLVFRSRVGGVNDQTVVPGYNPQASRFWRIRHDQAANTLSFATSPDRTTWTTHKTVTPGFSLSALRFYLMVGAWGTGNAAPGAVHFDNFQVATNETANSLPIANFGFEAPVPPAAGFQYGPTNAGWTFAGAGVTANYSPFTAANPPAPEKSQVAFLQGGSGSSITQSISGFQANTNYGVTFAAAQRNNYTNGGQDFQVYLGDILLGTFRPISMGYNEYSTPVFTTTTGAHTLKFAGLNSVGGDNTAFIDNVRVTIQPAGGFLPPLFTEDFNGASLNTAKWTTVIPNSTWVTQQSQRLQITIPPNTAGYDGVQSNSSFDFTNRMVQVEVVQPISQAGWCENFIQVWLDGSNYFLIDAGGGSMIFRSMVGGANNQTALALNAYVERFWRIRHDQNANTIYFETSSDGSTWTVRKTAAVGFSLTALRVSLFAGAWGTGNGAPGAAMYDNLQLLASAYSGVPQSIPGTIEPENYDHGGSPLAYFDTTPGSHGQDYDQPPGYPAPSYRQPANVDFYKSIPVYSNGYLVLMHSGDWMKYSVNVTQSGTYTLYARVIWGDGPGGTFHVEVDGVDKTGPIQIPNSNWAFTIVSKSGIQLTPGAHSVRLVADTNGTHGFTGDIDYLNFQLDP